MESHLHFDFIVAANLFDEVLKETMPNVWELLSKDSCNDAALDVSKSVVFSSNIYEPDRHTKTFFLGDLLNRPVAGHKITEGNASSVAKRAS